jgi:hypothetical protein
MLMRLGLGLVDGLSTIQRHRHLELPACGSRDGQILAWFQNQAFLDHRAAAGFRFEDGSIGRRQNPPGHACRGWIGPRPSSVNQYGWLWPVITLGERSDVVCQPLCLGPGLARKLYGQLVVWTKLARAPDLGLQLLGRPWPGATACWRGLRTGA